MDTVFFDMDGTLIDTEKYYNICWYEAITKFGYAITREEALDLRSLGRPHVYRFFEEKYGKDKIVVAMVMQKTQDFIIENAVNTQN